MTTSCVKGVDNDRIMGSAAQYAVSLQGEEQRGVREQNRKINEARDTKWPGLTDEQKTAKDAYRLSRSSNRQAPFQWQIPRAAANIHLIVSLLQLPLLRHNIPDTQISPCQIKVQVDRFSRLNIDLRETSQLPNRAPGYANIQLCDLRAINIA